MKREILCRECGAQPIRHYAGEGHMKIPGLALAVYRCDACNKIIELGDHAVAVSIWVGPAETPPAWPWWRSFLLIEKDPPANSDQI